MSFHTRRLPVYLLLDCSGSMSGEPIEAVRQGVGELLNDLQSDPQALETAHLGVITFNSTAQQLVPLTDLTQFVEPKLEASGTTALGQALEVLLQALDREVRTTTNEQKGDWKPLVFLMTDGVPTDSWKSQADRLRTKHLTLVACAAGGQADTSMLKQLTEVVVHLDSLQPEAMKQFFRWVTDSIKQTSSRCDRGSDGSAAAGALAPLPPEIRVVP